MSEGNVDKTPLLESPKLVKKEIIEKLLHPRIETDDGGFKRAVYSLDDKTFTFRGREELPVYLTAENNECRCLGSDSIFIAPAEYQRYKDNLQREGKNSQRHYNTTKDLVGLLDLAHEFAPSNPQFTKLAADARKGIYPSEALTIIDRVIAATIAPENGETGVNPSLAGSDGEAIVLLALLGNQEASDYVKAKLQDLYDYQQKFMQSKRDEYTLTGFESPEPTDPKSIAFVHATKYFPKKIDNHTYAVLTLFDATHGNFLRSTIHTTMNYKVQSHIGGNWDKQTYIVIGNGQSMLDKNGAPYGFAEEDTWWLRNPGEPLYFTDAVIISKAESPQEGLISVSESEVKYKGDDYTISDVFSIADYVKNNPGAKVQRVFEKINDVFRENFGIYYQPEDPISNQGLKIDVWDYDKLKTAFNEEIFSKEKLKAMYESFGFDKDKIDDLMKNPNSLNFDRGRFGNHILAQYFQEAPRDTKIADLVKNMISRFKLEKYLLSPDEKNALRIEEFTRQIIGDINAAIQTCLSEMTTCEVIKSRGQPLMDTDSWTLNGSVSRLGKQIGVVTSDPAGNSGSVYWGIDHFDPPAIKKVKNEPFLWKEDEVDAPIMDTLDPKTMRVIYVSGRVGTRIN